MSNDPQQSKRPRLTDAQRLARLNEQRAKIMARQKSTDRALDTRRKVIVGAAILTAIEADADLKARVCAVLETAVTRPIDREAIAPWLSLTSASR